MLAVDSARTLHSLKILIVEDDPLIASCVEEFLSDAQYNVVGVAGSAFAALSLLGEIEKPDVALVDINLTGQLDGIELACLIRNKPGVRTIFLTGQCDIHTKLKAEAAAPLAFLQKPFRPSTLFNTIQTALADNPPNPQPALAN